MDTLIREGNPPAGQLASPVPQVWDPTANGGAGGWVRVYGEHHASRAILYGPNGQPISTANRLPVEATLSGSSPPTLVRINSDRVVPAGTSVQWFLSSSERAEINRWPVFAIVVSWKVGSTNRNYSVYCWQYLPNSEGTSTPVPDSVQRIDTWSDNLSDRVFVARVRRFAMGDVILRITNLSPFDQILSNFAVQCMIA